jgi:uncharacterized protein (TIGR02145 family)
MKKSILASLLTFAFCLSLSSQQYGSLKDSRDGKIYKTVKIGEQEWMAENLNTDRFRNGDLIPEAKTDEEWQKAGANKQPAWCYYDNDPVNGTKYGKLYNWYAVNDPRGLASVGYHIPSDAEWDVLTTYLGEDVAGKKMKSASGWESYTTGGSKTCPNCESWNTEYRSKVACHMCKDTRSVSVPTMTRSGNGSNSSRFSGLPGGYRGYNGAFRTIGSFGEMWSSTGGDAYVALYRNLNCNIDFLYRGYNDKDYGLSVRCLRD